MIRKQHLWKNLNCEGKNLRDMPGYNGHKLNPKTNRDINRTICICRLINKNYPAAFDKRGPGRSDIDPYLLPVWKDIFCLNM